VGVDSIIGFSVQLVFCILFFLYNIAFILKHPSTK